MRSTLPGLAVAYHSDPSVAGSSRVTCRAAAWPERTVRGGSPDMR